jgi:hypothetical protein
VTTVDPIASTTLKWLRFKRVRCTQYLHHSAFINNGLVLFGITGFTQLHHIQSLADVTMVTKACNLL